MLTSRIEAHSGAMREFSQLSFSEQFLLWAIRNWMRASFGAEGLHAVLQDGFDHAGGSAAHRALDHFMSIVAVSARRSITIHLPNGHLVSPDEQHFLAMVADIQLDAPASVKTNLADWLAPAGVRAAMPALTGFALQILAAGHEVKHREGHHEDETPQAAAYVDKDKSEHVLQLTIH